VGNRRGEVVWECIVFLTSDRLDCNIFLAAIDSWLARRGEIFYTESEGDPPAVPRLEAIKWLQVDGLRIDGPLAAIFNVAE